jgi:hypothetical protein
MVWCSIFPVGAQAYQNRKAAGEKVSDSDEEMRGHASRISVLRGHEVQLRINPRSMEARNDWHPFFTCTMRAPCEAIPRRAIH